MILLSVQIGGPMQGSSVSWQNTDIGCKCGYTSANATVSTWGMGFPPGGRQLLVGGASNAAAAPIASEGDRS